MKKSTNRALRLCAIAAAGLAASAAAQAQLTYQGVTFTSSWAGNVLTIEIDAAHPTGDWIGADEIGTLQVKDVGSWTTLSFSGPGAAHKWTVSGKELGANGCSGGSGGNHRACAFGTRVPLSDNMIFTYTFTGGVRNFGDPHLKLQLFEQGATKKLGSLLSTSIPAIPEPGTYAMLLGGLGVLLLAGRHSVDNRITG